MIFCKGCQTEKSRTSFYERKSGTPRYPCKDCLRIEYLESKTEVAEKRKQQYAKNKNKILAYKKQYYAENRKRIIKQKNTYINNRMGKDLNYRLLRKLRTRILMAVKSNSKGGSAVECLGCSIEQFRIHIESQWKLGMSWENHTIHGWHLDHIIPLSVFDLTDPEQFKKACHYTNFQPLWAEDNWCKSAKVS